MPPVIATTQLTRMFAQNVAVNSLNLEIQAGEVFAFLGHNGAGKTTTVRLLNGVLAPTAGEVRVFGLSPLQDGAKVRARTGVLTETPSLDDRLTAHESLMIYADIYNVPRGELRKRVQTVLETFELADRGKEKVGSYSKGMKQRLALARMLLHEPELIFLDEPTASLDPIAIYQVHEMIRKMSREQGRTVFLATHNLHEAQQLADRVGVMDHGTLVAIGSPRDLAKQIGLPAKFEIGVAPEHLQTALDTLRDFRGVKAVSAADSALSITGADEEVIPDLLAALVGAGVRVYRVVPQEASLEDIYFTLYGEKADR